MEPALHAGICENAPGGLARAGRSAGRRGAPPQAGVDSGERLGEEVGGRRTGKGPRSKRGAPAAAPRAAAKAVPRLRRGRPLRGRAPAEVLASKSNGRRVEAAARGGAEDRPEVAEPLRVGPRAVAAAVPRARLAAALRRAQAARAQRRAAPEDAPARGPGAARDAGLRGQALSLGDESRADGHSCLRGVLGGAAPGL